MLNEFNFDLPEELIAQYPVERGEAKLLHRNGKGQLFDMQFKDIVDLLHEGDLLIMNNTKVIPACLDGKIENYKVKVNLIERVQSDDSEQWEVLGKPRKRLQIGSIIYFNDTFNAKVVEKNNVNGMDVIEFNSPTKDIFENELASVGKMPLPPYIKRSAETDDVEKYQTVYSQIAGSVAAPTAGLHFSNDLIEVLRQKGVEIAQVTLHIGGGTFLPIRSENIADHKMHHEYYRIDENTCELINKAKSENRRIIAVGTTSARTVESAALFSDTDFLQPHTRKTNLFITPGYNFKIIDGLITNFHLPKSTLFILICAFLGDIKTGHLVYKHAIEKKYRFFSYGDACFFTQS